VNSCGGQWPIVEGNVTITQNQPEAMRLRSLLDPVEQHENQNAQEGVRDAR
jgi:hypothetical protein